MPEWSVPALLRAWWPTPAPAPTRADAATRAAYAIAAQTVREAVVLVQRLERVECALRELLDARDQVSRMDIWKHDDDDLDAALTRLNTATAHARMLVGRRH